MASRTRETQALAFGPSAVAEAELEDREEVLEEVGDDDAEVEVDVLDPELAGDDVEPVGSSPVPPPHPTRAKTAKPAAARVR